VNFFLQTIVDGLSVGSLYAVFALGVALVFGIMHLINFAHGELIMIGAYAAIVVGRPLWIVIIVALAVSVLAAVLMERLAFRPVRNADPTTMLVTSFALSYGLQSLATAIFGSLQRGGAIAGELSRSVQVIGLSVPRLEIATITVTVAMLLALNVLLARTSMGVQMRAAAEDFPTARMLGVRANRVIAAAFAISGLFAGVGAVLFVAQHGYVNPTIGSAPVLAAFIATVVGGIGTLRGAVLGGYLLGLVSVLLHGYLPADLRNFQTAFAYAAVVACLLIRPQGLLASRAGITERA